MSGERRISPDPRRDADRAAVGRPSAADAPGDAGDAPRPEAGAPVKAGGGAVARIVRAAGAVRAWGGRPSNQRWLLAVAVVGLLVLGVVSFRSLPEDTALHWLPMLALFLVLAPAIWLLNALEYRAIARAADQRISVDSAIRVSFAASVANLLPVPGGVAVRTAALKLAGTTLRAAVAVNVIAGVLWVGTTALAVGVVFMADGELRVTGGVSLAVGAGIVAASAVVLRRRVAAWRRVFVELLLIEAASTLLASLQVAASLAAIGYAATVTSAVTIASSSVIAAAVGFFPAGLGIKEALAGALAVGVGVPAAVAVTASIVERALTLAAMGLFALGLWIRLRRVERRQGG